METQIDPIGGGGKERKTIVHAGLCPQFYFSTLETRNHTNIKRQLRED